MPFWIVLLPEKTGIFTSLNQLQEIIKMGVIDCLSQDRSLISAKQKLFRNYSSEQLFLFDIESIGDIRVDCWYYLSTDSEIFKR